MAKKAQFVILEWMGNNDGLVLVKSLINKDKTHYVFLYVSLI